MNENPRYVKLAFTAYSWGLYGLLAVPTFVTCLVTSFSIQFHWWGFDYRAVRKIQRRFIRARLRGDDFRL